VEYSKANNNTELYVNNATEQIGKVYYIADAEKTPKTQTLTYTILINYSLHKEVSVTG
jgi:hypothetical protein